VTDVTQTTGADAPIWPDSLSPKQVKWLEILVKTRLHKAADIGAQVSRMTSYRWRTQSGSDFAAAYDSVRRSVADWAEDQAMLLAAKDDPDVTTLLRILAAFRPERWSPRMDHKHQGTVAHEHIKRVTREDA